MTGGTGRRWNGGRRGLAALALFVLAWLVYHPGKVSQGYNLADPLLIVPTSLSLLADGDLELGEFAADVDPGFYGLLMLDGRPYNRYPVGASLVVLPFVWLAGPPAAGEPPLAHALRIAAPIAKLLAALSVVMLFLLLAEVTERPGIALGLAFVFAFASPHYPVHAGGLWTHNAVTPLVIAALLLVVVRDGRHAGWASLPLALAFATRPTTAPVIAVVSAYVGLWRPRALPAYVLGGTMGGALFVAWSWHMYGTALPPYYLGQHVPGHAPIRPSPTGEAFLGTLVSPNRGLFVFAPVFLFSLWGIARAFRSESPHAPIHRVAALAVVLHWVMISTWSHSWGGGWSFGPRNFMDVMPLLVLLLLPAIDAFEGLPRRARGAVASAGAVALAWSLFVAVHGATSFAPHGWNRTPEPVDRAPERLWDWSDMQILRGLRGRDA